MNAETFWSCVLAILFCVGLRTAIVVVLMGLENYLKSKLPESKL